MERIKSFIKGVRQEVDRVTWPDRKLVTKATISVIIFSLLIGVYLWLLDVGFTRMIHLLLSLRGS
ncbi:MAG: preprotein translocase subunit SecE [Hydrogenobacter thermophilus]|uniref:Protein translocase subunit SecE n=1 Tax=Hydrogenobacter thermophilus (strain DSM 6534 / IAM 12695 / TK-6) TaxID=608538 RepID=D3DHM2_HYDTT|nr:preprotein translocase subunit SecE [Hydrogenobacter thermophilus]ADO45261.1 preprotein translocase, SecE subunit [Hydrogenobacter thermophilus TK-6]MCS7284162.1 preprotein translocase subunit SecE [Hydrogenobacter thermophilus]QWK19764.1 MAG: preprotein translocase subunit SecE [Hydrogenobacter thermophilus]BAI69324.1 preprotein translocase SecE subunit [Hydrogenobacter thermophilus TK-6]